jgi:hypothetical protein
MLAASRRLASNFSALPFGLIQTFIGSGGRPLEGLILETAVGREKAVQTIYVHRKFLKLVVTLRVMRDFKNLLGA